MRHLNIFDSARPSFILCARKYSFPFCPFIIFCVRQKNFRDVRMTNHFIISKMNPPHPFLFVRVFGVAWWPPFRSVSTRRLTLDRVSLYSVCLCVCVYVFVWRPHQIYRILYIYIYIQHLIASIFFPPPPWCSKSFSWPMSAVTQDWINK